MNRQKERRDLAHALRDGRGRAYTLVGLGGVGKTALAAQVLQDVAEDFAGGVLWLSLEDAPKAGALCERIAAFYAMPPTTDAASARAALAQHQPLLALDNAESAPETAQDLLELCRGAATLLLTCRERGVIVGRGGPPLDVHPLPRADAMELFRARAGDKWQVASGRRG